MTESGQISGRVYPSFSSNNSLSFSCVNTRFQLNLIINQTHQQQTIYLFVGALIVSGGKS